jgi:hypothetical protein
MVVEYEVSLKMKDNHTMAFSSNKAGMRKGGIGTLQSENFLQDVQSRFTTKRRVHSSHQLQIHKLNSVKQNGKSSTIARYGSMPQK